MKYRTLMILFAFCAAFITACGGNAGSQTDTGDAAPVEELSLSEGEFYAIQATGAINSTYVSDNWGGEFQQRRLFDSGNWWTLIISGTNQIDATEVSTIQIQILKGLEAGSYEIIEGSILNSPDADEPVKLINASLRYPDFQILNDDEEFDGTLTIDSISDEEMSGTITLSLSGEGGDVDVTAIFDVPVVEPLE